MLGPNLGFHPLGLRRGDRGQAQLQACDFPLPLRLVKASEDFVTFGAAVPQEGMSWASGLGRGRGLLGRKGVVF